ncbi:MAG: hypothetical protein JWP82_3157 [Humibacillus sp.]|nr:hypothetical protein [Humibacillus sp.]
MQPAYLVVELVVAAIAATASVAYSLRDDTISSLGQLTCAPGHSGSDVSVCSPAHLGLDAAFIVFGLLRVVGAVVLSRQLAAGPARTTATLCWVVSGLASAAVGVAPVDAVPTVHSLVAAPVFVLQPLAVLATAAALRHSSWAPRWVVVSGLGVGAFTAAAAVAFGVRIGSPTWVGGLERLALWPTYPWLGVVGWVALTAHRPRARRARRAPHQRPWGE